VQNDHRHKRKIVIQDHSTLSVLGVSGKLTRDQIILYNNVSLNSKAYEDIHRESKKTSHQTLVHIFAKLPNDVVMADNINVFKNHLDKFWSSHDFVCLFRTQPLENGSVKYNTIQYKVE